MLTKEEIKAKAERMQSYLDLKPGSEPNELIDRIENLLILVSQSGNYLSDAKYHQDGVVNGAIMEALQKAYEEKLSPSTINLFVKTAAKELNYLVNWLDRINATATHQIDATRSILSYRKTEMQL